MFYSWKSMDDFQHWHNMVMEYLGIPHPNANFATGEVDENAQWTTSYTTPIDVAIGDTRAYVEDHIAPIFVEYLGIQCDPPPSPVEE